MVRRFRRDVVTNDDDVTERPGRAFCQGLAHFGLKLRQSLRRESGFQRRFTDGLPAAGIQWNALCQARLTIGLFPFARHQNRRVRLVRRLFTPVDEGFRLALHVRRVEGLRVENNGGHAVEDGVDAGLQALLVSGLAAGDGAAEDFAQRGEGVAFMLGKGQQGAQRRGLHDRRVGGRFASGVNQRTGRNGFAFMPGDARFAKSNRAGGVVEQ